MPYTFIFLGKHPYDTTKTGITVPVELSHGPNAVQVDAKLDTGASFCIFKRTYPEVLGQDVERGVPETVSTATGAFRVYGHRLSMAALGFQFKAMVYYAADESVVRSVLGRRGFIEQLRLCLIEHDGELYVSKYDDE